MAETANPPLSEDEDFDSSHFDFDRLGIFTVISDFDDVDPFEDLYICPTDPQPHIEDKLGCDLNDTVEELVGEEVVQIASSASSVVDPQPILGIGVSGDDLVGGDSVVVDDLVNPFADDPFFGSVDGNGDEGFDFGWLGLGLGFERGQGCADDDDDDDDASSDDLGGVIFDEFAESSEPYMDRNGVGVVEIESDSDNGNGNESDDDDEGDGVLGGISVCSDCRRLEESNEDLEWERVEEERNELRRELHRSLVMADIASLVSLESDYEGETPIDEVMRNMEWEVPEHDSDDEEDYMYQADHDLAFGRGNPPAAKSVIDNLPPMSKNNVGDCCAICKDEILGGEATKQLPCKHYYHGECIVPWLGIRNTCPVCRFELPTDDTEYKEEDSFLAAMAAMDASLLELRYG